MLQCNLLFTTVLTGSAETGLQASPFSVSSLCWYPNVSSQCKRLRAGKESPPLSLQRRAQNNQCNSKLFMYPRCHRDLRSSVMVQINHTAHVKKPIISKKKKNIFYKPIRSIQRKELKPTRTKQRRRKVQGTNQPSDLSLSQQYSPDTLRLSPQ